MTLTAVAEGWSSLYSNSWMLRSCVSFAHIGGLVGAGGCAVMTDRATILAYRRRDDERRRHLEALGTAHRIVMGGLSVVAISGVLLLLADLDAYLHAVAFWVKMAGVAALVINGGVLFAAWRKAVDGDSSAWLTLARASVVSLILWSATTLAGAVLPNAL